MISPLIIYVTDMPKRPGTDIAWDWVVLGAFFSCRTGSYMDQQFVCIYIQCVAASWLCTVYVCLSVILPNYCLTSLSLVTWGSCVAVLQVLVDLSRVDKKSYCQSWAWNPMVNLWIMSSHLHLSFTKWSRKANDFFLWLLRGARTKYVNWIGTW